MEIKQVVNVLGLTPTESGPYIQRFSDGRWWLLGCKEGDQPLPIGRACETESEALESVADWLADELETTEDLRATAAWLRRIVIRNRNK